MDFVKTLLFLLALSLVYLGSRYIKANKKKRKIKPWTPPQVNFDPIPIDNAVQATDTKNIQYLNAYEPKYLLTLNEKEQFKRMKLWAEQNGYIVFCKVRLLDLITPRKDINNYKGALWKIQAKHVDFVICDQNIRIKCIIEISDSSHKQKDRSDRDNFVNEILNNCGYKIIQTHNITEKQLNKICGIDSI